MNRRFVRTFELVGLAIGIVLFLLIVRTNSELFKDIQSYQRLLKDAQERADRMTEEKTRWENTYARTRESWIAWQIESKLKDIITGVESIELGNNDDGIAYVQEGGVKKRYSFRFASDRNNTALVTDVQLLP
ncbi:hypothetical protein HY409_02440 [Candidatus Gottesmanbacteria bacterium]|nr:hypothetical protein [Candidatus Gottesmanbacteria bacterium]